MSLGFPTADWPLLVLRPAWLLALVPLAVLIWYLARTRRQSESGWRSVVDPRLAPHVLGDDARQGARAGWAAVGAGMLLALIALIGLARPGPTDLAWRTDAARVLVVDMSPGMAASDLRPGAAERARLKVLDLLRAAPGGDTALIAYSDEPYVISPLTSDAATIALLVPEVAPDIMPLPGDRPDRALRLAADLLNGSGAGTRDIVWLTSATDERLLRLASSSSGDGLRLSVLHIPVAPEMTENAGPTSVDALRSALEATGGRYLVARPDGADVQELANLFAQAGRTLTETQRAVRHAREIGPWLVLLLLPLAALAFRPGVLAALALPLLLLAPADEASAGGSWWASPDREGYRLLQAGDPAAAAGVFDDPRWRAVALYRAGRYEEAAAEWESLSDPESLYNRGNALAQLERLEEALQAYEAALHFRPDDPDILHNRDLVREALSRRPPDQPPTPDDASDSPSAPPSGAPSDQRDGPDGAGNGESSRAPDDTGGSSAAGPQGEADDKRPGQAPPIPRPAAGRSDPAREAALLAEQWLRRVPDAPGGLLRRKLELEHARRHAQERSQP